MKYIALTFVAIWISVIHVAAQFVTEMVEYHPAPGQLINTEGAGSFKAAGSVAGTANGLVSLGSYGGRIVLGFEKPVLNDPDNPYGVDFVIFGNPQPDWAEPGIVMVMKDENKNGKADDTWYELAGSDYFFSTTKHQFSVSYFNPQLSGIRDISWVSSDSLSGYIYSNSFHSQDYYPAEEFFETTTSERVSFMGTKIRSIIDFSDPSYVKSYQRRFGYADNILRNNSGLSLPDNPYTDEVEGCGGDAMDIGWAVDGYGNYVDLDQIDFVKIYTGVLDNAGWLGEISTEICGIADVPVNTVVKGPDKCVVINDVPRKLYTGDSYQLEALSFQNGRLLNGKLIRWNVDNSQIATINELGLLELKKNGKFKMTASLADDQSIFATLEIEVITPSRIDIVIDSDVFRVDEETEIKVQVRDDSQNIITGSEIEWSVPDTNVLSVIYKNGKHYVKGLNEGSCSLEVHLKNRPEVKASVSVTILSESLQKEVFVTLKDEYSTLIEHDTIVVRCFNLNPFVDQAKGLYGIQNVSGITIAHAIAQLFVNLGFDDDLRFRDDEKGGNNLYLWKVPKGDTMNVEYIYGYGGSTVSSAYSKSWVILLNNERIINGLDRYLLKNGDELIVYHVTDITSVTHNYQAGDVKIWPQPATDFITILVSNQVISSLKILDMGGKEIVGNKNVGSQSVSINTNGMNSGIYILQIYTEQGFSNHKISIQ